MRVASRVVLIACSASAMGAPAAIACSPQDYMSPEDWQALSPQQRSDNVGHTHAAGDTGTTPADATIRPADAPATRDAAPGLTQPVTSGPETGRVEPPPVRGAAPAMPRLDGPPHPKRAEKRRATVGTPRGDESPTRSAAPAPAPVVSATDSPSTPRAVPPARTTIVAAEQLSRLDGSRAAERAAARRAAERRRGAAEAHAPRRSPAGDPHGTDEPRSGLPADAGSAGRVPVEADEAPATVAPAAEAGRAAAWVILLAVAASIATVLWRLRRPDGPVVATSAADGPAPHDSLAVAVDPVEAELQAIIAAHASTAGERTAGGQEAGTGDESSTATNSA